MRLLSLYSALTYSPSSEPEPPIVGVNPSSHKVIINLSNWASYAGENLSQISVGSGPDNPQAKGSLSRGRGKLISMEIVTCLIVQSNRSVSDPRQYLEKQTYAALQKSVKTGPKPHPSKEKPRCFHRGLSLSQENVRRFSRRFSLRARLPCRSPDRPPSSTGAPCHGRQSPRV